MEMIIAQSDGTGVRDYIHVVDLSKRTHKSIRKVRKRTKGHIYIYNLGTAKDIVY